jgi:hypothetical protein
MVSAMVILLDECLNIGLKRAWQIVIFQQDAVPHGLVPAFDLALDLSRVYAVLITHLGRLAFEGQGAFAPQS